MSIICGHSMPFSQTFPVSGMTRRGLLYELPTSAHRTDDTDSSSSPGLLPTPAAGNPNDGENPETWLARRERAKETHQNGNGMGVDRESTRRNTSHGKT